MQIKNESVIISGGASGMGEACARWLSERGAKVTVLDLNEEAAAKVADSIGGFAVACDVVDAAAVENAVGLAREKHGPARMAIACAGIAPAKRIVGKEGAMPLEDFRRVIEINLVGTFNLMRVAAADMTSLEPLGESGERGVIITTASVAAYEGQIGQAAYSASKGGVIGMTLPAARELARFGVRIMTIAPGIIGTPMLLNMPEKVQVSLAESVPFPKRLGKPEEYAALAGHIIENEMLNGSVIRMDGAIRMT